MDYENYKLCKSIEAVDCVLSRLVDNDVIITKGTTERIVFDYLMDLRNDLEKQIWLNNNPEYNKEES